MAGRTQENPAGETAKERTGVQIPLQAQAPGPLTSTKPHLLKGMQPPIDTTSRGQSLLHLGHGGVFKD